MEEGNVGGEMGGEEKRESSGHSASARPDAPCSAKHACRAVCAKVVVMFFLKHVEWRPTEKGAVR